MQLVLQPGRNNHQTHSCQDNVTNKVPISGIGGISTWRDAVEFMLLGSTSVQVCTAAMKHGFRIVEDMCEGLNNWMDEKGFNTIYDFIGKSVDKITHWEDLYINYHHIAKIINGIETFFIHPVI